MVKVHNFSYDDPAENLPRMARLARDFKFDMDLIDLSDWDSVKFSVARYGALSPETARDLFNFVQTRYILEQEEQFLRPLYFAAVFGDCDDQAIFVAAFYLRHGIPPDDIYLVESAQTEGYFEHIFTMVPRVGAFDALPGLRFGELSGTFFRQISIKELLG